MIKDKMKSFYLVVIILLPISVVDSYHENKGENSFFKMKWTIVVDKHHEIKKLFANESYDNSTNHHRGYNVLMK